MELFQRLCQLVTLYLFMVLPAGVMARQQLPPSFKGYYVMPYNDENGLPSNDVTGFFEDLKGYCWFTTQFGLIKFDGRDFRHFYTGNVPSLTSDRLYSLNAVSQDKVFFADESAGVHVIDSNGAILPVPGLKARHNFLMSQHGYILDLRKYFASKEDSTRIITEVRASKHYLPMHEFYSDANGAAWFVSGHDISWFKDGYFSPVDYYDLEDRAHFYIQNTLFAIDSIGGIRVYQHGKKTAITLSLQKILPAFAGKKHIDLNQLRFCSDRSGTFLQCNNKLYALQFDGQTVTASLLLKDLPLPLARHICYSERYKLYFFLTSTNGFYIIREQPFVVRSYKEGMENSFAATLEIQPGQVFTSNGLLFSKDTVQRVYNYNLQVFNTMLKDRDQHIWFMGGDTLFCMNNQLQEQKRWLVKDTHLKSLQQDDKGTIWLCTNNGLARIDSGRLKVLYADYTPLDRSQCMFFLNDTCIWIGTTVGLFAYNKRTNSLTAIPEMAKNYVRHIYRAKDSSVWIGTYGQGFYTYRNGRFIALPQDRNHNLATAHCFMEDDNGFFWIPTNKGLFQASKASLEAWVRNNELQVYYHYYDKNDGFGTNEFNGGSSPVGIRLQDGRFSLPSMKGLVWFDPRLVKPILPVQAIHIDKIMEDAREISYQDKLVFRAGSNKMSFRISSPFFGNSDNFFPEYRIAGVDKLWAPVPADNTIVINFLPPGNYALEVRLRSGFGAHDYTSATLPFFITPHFYETVAFRLLLLLMLILLITAGIYSLHKQKAKKAKERELYLEQQVQQRTQEQAITVQQLEHTVGELKVSQESLHQSNLLKDKLTSVILHDIRSPLRFMNMLSNQLHNALIAGNNQSLTSLTAELKKSSDQLDTFTKEFLIWLTTQQEGFRMRYEHVYVKELFQEAETFFRNVLNWNKNSLEMEITADISAWTDKQLLKIILHNLVDNANKHTENGQISLKGYLDASDRLVIKVADTGEGMTYTELQVLQSRLEDEKNLFATDSTGNLGYRIVRDFVAQLKGHIAVESIFQKGTTVTIVFPPGPDH
ncbi:ligand-binding sensor domain-containing protein [Paraflavitalea soli]|nr:ATP-binding protein [Paraflavitalea soli]